MEISNSKKEGELLSWNDINKRMKYSWSVASEVLRLDPPSPAGDFREALTDFKIDNFLIPSKRLDGKYTLEISTIIHPYI
ncbi:hypothetical protein LIER_10439 [Lithospermum erythrorhizon]|uniref:Uncharacterized protein n=1 Tax=Lithospermum erythrorhizon TaxID=34254 RepID=A0AAV3PKK7_LITER